MRTQKAVGSTVYNYYYADGLLIRQTWGSNYIDFLYDENGSAYSFIYNGTQYYYVHNLQGDVVKILNTSSGVVASYTYDAWGNASIAYSNGGASTTATYNPFRYRGYYFDSESGFYYLNSRYYDPAIGRFISPDAYINANGDLIGFNMYAYCGNNPVNYIDPTSEAWGHWIAGAAIVGLCAVATIVTCGGFAAAATAVALVASGTAAATVASTIAASAFITSSMALGTVVLSAAMDSSSLEDFGDQGNWGTVAYVSTAAIYGGGYGYNLANIIPREYKGLGRHTSGTGSPQKNSNPNGSYTKVDHKGQIHSYTQFDGWGRQTFRIDFQGKKHAGVLPHIHTYDYLPRGGRREITYDLQWNKIGD